MNTILAWIVWFFLMTTGLVMVPSLIGVFPFSSLPLSSSYLAGPISLDRPVWFHREIRGYWTQGKVMLNLGASQGEGKDNKDFGKPVLGRSPAIKGKLPPRKDGTVPLPE